MVRRIGTKGNSTPFPAEPHVLMYILRGWRKLCGTSYVPKFCEKPCVSGLYMREYNKWPCRWQAHLTRIDRVNFDKCACSALNVRVWTVTQSTKSAVLSFERVVPPGKRVLARNGYVSRVCGAPYGSKWKCFGGFVVYATCDLWLKFSVDSTFCV